MPKTHIEQNTIILKDNYMNNRPYWSVKQKETSVILTLSTTVTLFVICAAV